MAASLSLRNLIMDLVTLTPEGRLLLDAEDVTYSAHELLFNPIALASGATLGSVLELVRQVPVLRSLFRRYDVDNLLVEALGAVPPYPLEGGVQAHEIEYAALYRSLFRDSKEKTLGGANYLNLHGVGFVATSDRYCGDELTCKKGDRTYFAFDLTSARHLVHLPLRLDTAATVVEPDSSEPWLWNSAETLRCEEASLGEVLDAVLSELVWVGAPSAR